MRVYIAAPYAARAQAKAYADELGRIGIAVVSRWVDETHEIGNGTVNAAPDLDDHTVRQHIGADIDDLRKADVLVLLTNTATGLTSASGGRHFETGWFVANNGFGELIVVGEAENIFHRAYGVTVVPDWHEAVLELAARHRSRLLDAHVPVAG